MRRNLLGMSQEKLGDALNLTFQQVQKYEKGTNRVGASRLQHISQILQVPPSFFFEGAPQAGHGGKQSAGERDAGAAADIDFAGFMSDHYASKLVKDFPHLDTASKKIIVDTIDHLLQLTNKQAAGRKHGRAAA
jgi:transcriptional regulator with XRE-family HTH domain